MEGASYMREVGDEPMGEAYEAHKGLNLGDVLWGRPVPDAGNFDAKKNCFRGNVPTL